MTNHNQDMKPSVFIQLATLLFFSPLLSAADWSNWRGPEMNGSSPASDTPVTFSADQGVRWAADMPGPAASTPVISGNYVFVSSTDQAKKNLLALAYDLKSGKELWRHVVGQGLKQDDRSNYAGASPVSDGKHVVFFYGTGDLAVFTVAGKPVWKKKISRRNTESFIFCGHSPPAPSCTGKRSSCRFYSVIPLSTIFKKAEASNPLTCWPCP
jgi:hypothetical protein